MDNKPRFTLQITLRDNYVGGDSLHMAIDLADEVRISSRAVDELKSVGSGLSTISMDGAIRIMRVREFRKKLFIEAAKRLGALLAERMEDAEGWHDADRIEPARKQLGGDW